MTTRVPPPAATECPIPLRGKSHGNDGIKMAICARSDKRNAHENAPLLCTS